MELDYRAPTAEAVEHTPVKSQERQPQADEADKSSLLTSQPVDVDSILASIRPSPSFNNARSALKKLSTANKPLTNIGAEHLRSIGDLISNLQQRIEAVRAASQLIENHLDLQSQEFQRQVLLLQTTSSQLDQVKSHNPVKRAEGMMVEQERLAGRMEKVLSGLTMNYRPPIGEVEKTWFDELESIKIRVQGGKGFGINRGGGLQAQIDEVGSMFL